MKKEPKSQAPNSSSSYTITQDQSAQRLDLYLAAQLPAYSRSYIKKLIEAGHVTVNKKQAAKSGMLLKTDDAITITFPDAPTQAHIKEEALNLPIEIVFEHPHFMILNKPPYVAIHKPYPDATQPTLVDWLLAKHTTIALIGYADRPGIVHRLDKDTSGLLIIARTNYAHAQFTNLFKQRDIHKTYLALVKGHPNKEGAISLWIARHPTYRTKMATSAHERQGARAATTQYKVLTYFDDCALVELKPLTGRTHQIRVHMAAIGHPLIGDTLYGSSSSLIKRQALHASALSFVFDNQPYYFKQELPADFQKAIDTLSARQSTR